MLFERHSLQFSFDSFSLPLHLFFLGQALHCHQLLNLVDELLVLLRLLFRYLLREIVQVQLRKVILVPI